MTATGPRPDEVDNDRATAGNDGATAASSGPARPSAPLIPAQHIYPYLSQLIT